MCAFVMEAATVLLYPLSLYCKRRAVMPERAYGPTLTRPAHYSTSISS